MLGIDECGDAAHLLRFCDSMQCQRRLTGGLRPIDLDDTPARITTDTDSDIKGERAVGMTSISSLSPISPRRMMEPAPNSLVICFIAFSSAFCLSCCAFISFVTAIDTSLKNKSQIVFLYCNYTIQQGEKIANPRLNLKTGLPWMPPKHFIR